MTVHDIIKGWLIEHGYDGLYHANDCGCEVGDLFPCGEVQNDCAPGHKIPCDPETCSADGDCPHHIGERT